MIKIALVDGMQELFLKSILHFSAISRIIKRFVKMEFRYQGSGFYSLDSCTGDDVTEGRGLFQEVNSPGAIGEILKVSCRQYLAGGFGIAWII
jgi:hypothetical protein